MNYTDILYRLRNNMILSSIVKDNTTYHLDDFFSEIIKDDLVALMEDFKKK